MHPDIRKHLDIWIAVVGGVHSHLISRVQRDKSQVGCFMSQNEIMTTVFPMFQQHIEPHLVEAHVCFSLHFCLLFFLFKYGFQFIKRGKTMKCSTSDCDMGSFFLLQLKIRNDFDPVLSAESSLFVLKSNKQVSSYLLLEFDIVPCLMG